MALKSHVQVCGKLVCQTCSKSYRATDGLEKHLRAHKDGFQIDVLKSIAHWLIEKGGDLSCENDWNHNKL